MAAAPYYLLAVGVAVMIVGIFIANVSGGERTYIDPRMSDKEIARQMKKNQPSPLGGIIMGLGALIILVSIVWRIVLIFV